MTFKMGDRVQVRGHWNWPCDCTGVVCLPPEFGRELVADEAPWSGVSRTVKGRKGPIEFIWVNFDEPQKDGDGDGPYWGGEVEAEYLALEI